MRLNNFPIIKRLFDKRNQNNYSKRTYDNHALRWSARNGHLNVVKYLYENGANIHAFDNWAIRYAAKHGHLEVVKFIHINTEINANRILKRVLCCAITATQTDVVEYIINYFRKNNMRKE